MEDHYETYLIWKESRSLLSDNKYGTTGRFLDSVKNLRRANKIEAYHNIIQEQKANEIIEKVEVDELNEAVTETVFYFPYRPVIRESVETTKKGIAYEAPAKASQTSASLNECLETGPSLQNRLWNILIPSRLALYNFVVK